MNSTPEIYHARCKACGGQAAFRPGKDALECEHCGTLTPIEKAEAEIVEQNFDEFLQRFKNNASLSDTPAVNAVKCKSCGAETTFPKNITSWECAYCGTPLVIQDSIKEQIIPPHYLLPFKIDRKESEEKFRKWVNGLWFAPNDLKMIAGQSKEKLKGVYVPFWTFDFDTTTQYTGVKGEYYYVTQTYKDTNGLMKTRQVRQTRWYPPQNGVIHQVFDDVMVCASKVIPDTLKRELNNWDKENLQPVKPEYMAGFISEIYSLPPEEGLNIAKEEIQPQIHRAICKDIGGDTQQVLSKNTRYNNITFKHILLPVWVSSYKYGNKIYRFVINARTGRVYGERPWSTVKILLFVLTVALLIWILMLFGN
ncbi:MAG: hypothetical protein N3F09_00170 [Bacteroidia bacterium]|nr:hypothetical protein [Bacteroidia bacterium]